MHIPGACFRNSRVLLACLLFSGCGSFQSVLTHLESTGAISPAETTAPSSASANQNSAPERSAPETTARIAARPEGAAAKAACDRGKAISVGMTVNEVYASCWGKPKNVNTSVLGSTKMEMLFYEGYNYVYLENGIVKSIESSGR